MRMSTTGIELRTRHLWLRGFVELVSSMRFAISLLTAICVAAVIGTVVPQNEPYGNYINQLGPVWADVFATAGLTAVYSAWWFLVLLAFLVLSTLLCVARHAPKILADLRDYKENLREQSLQAFHFKGREHTVETPPDVLRRVSGLLANTGWRLNRPLKKCSSNAPGSWISKKRVVQTRLRSECEGHFGLFAGRFARFGRTYPMAHA